MAYWDPIHGMGVVYAPGGAGARFGWVFSAWGSGA